MGRHYRCGTAGLVDWDFENLAWILSECHRMTSSVGKTSSHTVSVSKINNIGKEQEQKSESTRLYGVRGGCFCLIKRPNGSIGLAE